MTRRDERGSGKVAVITGASQGLGLALAEELAARGWRLVLDARRADRLERAAASVRARAAGAVAVDAGAAAAVGVAVEAVPGDMADPAHRDALLAAAWRLGRVELLVNNASTLGASPLPLLQDISLDVLRRTLEVNLVAPLALVQAFPAARPTPVRAGRSWW